MKIKNDYHNLFTYHSAIEITENGVIIYPFDNGNTEFISFSNVKKFEIKIGVQEQYYKGGYYSKLGDMNICLVTKDRNEKYTILTKGSWRKVYNLLDYKKYFPKFEIKASGASDGIDIPIKVYSKFGEKLWIKDNDSILGVEFAAGAFTGVAIWRFIETFINNQMPDFEISFALTFAVLSMILLIPVLYQEYRKYKIRKMLGL